MHVLHVQLIQCFIRKAEYLLLNQSVSNEVPAFEIEDEGGRNYICSI